MKTLFFYLVLSLLAVVVQSTLIFTETRPDIVLVLVCFYSLKYGHIKGMTYGALTGLLIDIANGVILGPNIASKALAGFLIVSMRHKLFHWNALINTVMIAFLSLVDILVVYICLETFTTMSFIEKPWGISIMQIFYTAITGLILYPVIAQRKTHEFSI